VRTVASLVLAAAVLAGCGDPAPPAPPAPREPAVRASAPHGPLAPPSTGALRFARAPAARILPDGEIVVVARLSGPLPRGRARFMVDGPDPDLPQDLAPSAARLRGTHDCYAQTARLGPGPIAGQRVTVTLTIRGAAPQRLTATVRLGRARYGISTHALARRLGCDRYRRAA